MTTRTITTQSEDETVDAARALGAALSAGQVVLLFGDLGAGKTAFVRGLAEGLGIAGNEVSSPTFTLVQEYRGGSTISDWMKLAPMACSRLNGRRTYRNRLMTRSRCVSITSTRTHVRSPSGSRISRSVEPGEGNGSSLTKVTSAQLKHP
jgi:hypothetical protein